MSVEGVFGGYNGRGKVLTELAFEHLDDIDESTFELRGKLHDDIAFLEGVFHDVFMVVS